MSPRLEKEHNSTTKAYKVNENRKYRQRRKISQTPIWIETNIRNQEPIWLESYIVPLVYFHDYFDYVMRINKGEDPYVNCLEFNVNI